MEQRAVAGGAEECLGCGHVAMLAQHGVNQVAIAVEGAVETAPAARDF
jgi:hypothetical protein